MAWTMSWTEVAGFVTGAVCVWLCVRGSVWNFPIGLANNLVYGAVFLRAGLYADAGLQVVYLVLGVLGWYWWVRGGVAHTALEVREAPRWAWPAVLAFVGVATICLQQVLSRFTDSSVPWGDAVTTALSLGAQVMLNRKWIGNWWLWITADLIYIVLYAYKGLALTSVLYVLFLAMCVVGVVQWRRVRSASLDLGRTPTGPAPRLEVGA